MRKSFNLILVTVTALLTTACASVGTYDPGQGSVDVLTGPGITRNHTPYTTGLMCVGEHINKVVQPKTKLRISIGSIPDLTGKFSDNDSGYKVTQGATLMAMSALGKMKAVRIVERGDTSIFDFEIKLADKPNRSIVEGSGMGTVSAYTNTNSGLKSASSFSLVITILPLPFERKLFSIKYLIP